MKLCDAHAHIGHWPFHSLPFTDARSLLNEMNRLSIERSAVCHTHAVFYKNTQAANEELAKETRNLRDRLSPVATLNPLYVQAEEDFRICVDSLGMAGLRLVPQYHGYGLDDARAVALAEAAGKAKMPVLVPRILVDPRQRHWMDVEATVPLEALVAFARKVPGTSVVGAEYILSADDATVKSLKSAPNLLFEISRISYLQGGAIPGLIEKVGPDRLLFGTGVPFKVPEVTLLKMEMVAGRRARERIGSGTFSRIFPR